jgi:hypothetical protein
MPIISIQPSAYSSCMYIQYEAGEMQLGKGMIEMASSFTWLDYSDKDRQKMLDILNTLREHETRDELGIGVVRDAFSDMFFPGTSTIQTRARYFLFVPWVYKGLEERKVLSSKIERRARDEEVRLIYALLESDDTVGVIGKREKKNLKRLPSSIYWQGLEAWGIRLCPYSISDYHRSLEAFYRFSRDSSHTYEEEIDGCDRRRNWHPGLPQAPDDFPDRASFNLTDEEACYLKERVLTRWPNTMLGYLLDFDASSESVLFPWDHPICHDLPESIREQLVHARNFSEAMYGAALLYNLMLAEKASMSGGRAYDGMMSSYEDELEEWADYLQSRKNDLDRWDYRRRLWGILSEQGARVSGQTWRFIVTWLQMALSSERARKIAGDESARRLIQEREKLLKRNLARLDNPEALARWSGDAGTGRLRYRWRPAEKIISDILLGLRRS